ncbi:hypothetical protein ACFSTI_27885 [Rhizorhabdus histidinilytica]
MIGKVAAACAALLVLAPHAAQGQGMGSLQAGMPLRDADYPGVIRLAIDARDVSRAILRGTMTLPVTGPGPMTIYFPRWVPGHHAPSGPIARIAGLTVHAEGTRIGWKRDPVMMHAIHIDVPEGTDTIELGFQYLSPTDPKMGRIEVSPAMIDLQWTSLAPYPAGYPSRRMTVQASVRLPDAWQFATALTTDSVADGVIRFKPVDYETLVDRRSSPAAIPRATSSKNRRLRSGWRSSPTGPSCSPPPLRRSKRIAGWSTRASSCSDRATTTIMTSCSA